jgi:hypothetical protein
MRLKGMNPVKILNPFAERAVFLGIRFWTQRKKLGVFLGFPASKKIRCFKGFFQEVDVENLAFFPFLAFRKSKKLTA